MAKEITISWWWLVNFKSETGRLCVHAPRGEPADFRSRGTQRNHVLDVSKSQIKELHACLIMLFRLMAIYKDALWLWVGCKDCASVVRAKRLVLHVVRFRMYVAIIQFYQRLQFNIWNVQRKQKCDTIMDDQHEFKTKWNGFWRILGYLLTARVTATMPHNPPPE